MAKVYVVREAVTGKIFFPINWHESEYVNDYQLIDEALGESKEYGDYAYMISDKTGGDKEIHEDYLEMQGCTELEYHSSVQKEYEDLEILNFDIVKFEIPWKSYDELEELMQNQDDVALLSWIDDAQTTVRSYFIGMANKEIWSE